jgi:antitoxin CptB
MATINPQQVFWHSRRGMLELDLLLVPFATEAFTKLSDQDQLLYVDLLEQEDQDLFLWLMGRAQPIEARFVPMIAQILAHSKSSV